MKNTILIKLIVPSLSQEFDLFIPINERVDKVIEMLKKALIEISDQTIRMDSDWYLIHATTGIILDHNKSIHDLKIKNSAKLMLFHN